MEDISKFEINGGAPLQKDVLVGSVAKVNRDPLISIIVPVYNSEAYLRDALDSVVTQTYKNLEVVLINNGSAGNVHEIYQFYKKQYPNLLWKYLAYEKNVGVYLAWMLGCSQMAGDYFTFLDSDDSISVDYYYQLLNKAQEECADVVSAEYYHDFVGKQGKVHFPMSDMELMDFCWEGADVLKNFMEARGRTFSYHALWSKLYSRSIWEKSKEFMLKINRNLTACIDPFVTTVFMSNAKKWVNVHNVRYRHMVNTKSATETISSDSDKIKAAFDSVYECFVLIKDYLIYINRFDELEKFVNDYKLFFVALMFTKIKNSELNKKKLYAYGCKLFALNKPVFINELNYLLETNTSPFNDKLESVRQSILSPMIKIISFDVFDTLIERPFMHPDDTYEFLSIEYNKRKESKKYINFAECRRRAQVIAYKRVLENHPFYKDITLDEIYEELVYEGIFDEVEAEEFKKIEIELEMRFCKVKQFGKLIYDFAVRAGKKIICISDMYLPADVIEKILLQNGYTAIDKVYVSSRERVCKSDGQLYKVAMSDYKVFPFEVCHFGDAYGADYLEPQKLGMNSVYVSSSREMLMGFNGYSYTGQSFNHIWGEYYDFAGSMGFLGSRCMVGLAANKVFGNPFVTFDSQSDFDCNPNIIGYYLFGTYVFTIAKWLIDSASERCYDTIHFIARDGYVFKQAYDVLAAHSKKKCPKSNYLHLSRSAMMPLLIQHKGDIFGLRYIMTVQSLTPMKFLKKMEQVIPESVYRDREQILRARKIIPDVLFETDERWNEFVKVYLDEFFFEECIKKYRSDFKRAFEKIIGPNDCTFDAGYSARTETMLYETCGSVVDAFYLFVMEEKAFIQAEKIGMKLAPFHKEWIGKTLHTILETIICSTEGSCSRIDFDDAGNIRYFFDEPKINDQTAFVLNIIQKRAVEYVSDFVETFPEWEQMQYRGGEKPFMYYIQHAKKYDKGILQKLVWHDPLCIVADLNFEDLWCSVPYVSNRGDAVYIYKDASIKTALVNYFRKNTPDRLRPFAKQIKRLLKW